MSDLSDLMKAAAHEPTEGLDPEAAWQKGRRLRTSRAVLTSTLTLVLLIGAGLALARTLPLNESTLPPAGTETEVPLVEEMPCEDQVLPEDDVYAYCIARGTYDGELWFYGGYFDEDENVCIHLEGPGEEGGTSCKVEDVREINLGLSTGGPGSPILEAFVPKRSTRTVITTDNDDLIETPLYDAPDELGLSARFVLMFDLPRGSQEMIAYDSSGSEIGRASLVKLLNSLGRFDSADEDGGGWMIAHGLVDEESWGLSANHRENGEVLCVTLGLGNDTRTADVEVGATSCYPSYETSGLSLEQVWWEGLGAKMPIFGAVARDVHAVELRLTNGEVQKIDIKDSPAEGPWRDESVYEVNFIVAFPPVGATGEVVALDIAEQVTDSWTLCMTPEKRVRPFAACDQGTEFWQP